MKKTCRFLALLLTLMLTAALLASALSASAQSPQKDSLLSTVEAIEAVDPTLTDAAYGTELLKLEVERRTKHYSTTNKLASVTLIQQVQNQMKPYRDLLEDAVLLMGTDNTPEGKETLRDLALREMYMGTLAWIYYRALEQTPAIENIEVSVSIEISGATDPLPTSVPLSTFFNHLKENIFHPDGLKSGNYFATREPSEAYRYFTELLRAVYDARLQTMTPTATLSDSEKANKNQLLAAARAELATLSYTEGTLTADATGTRLIDGEDAGAFELLCEKTARAMTLAEVQELLFPAKTFSELTATQTLTEDLTGKSSVAEVNAVLKQTMDDLLSLRRGSNVTGNAYTYAYVESLRTTVSDAFASADAADTLIPSEVMTLPFASYEKAMEKAEAKDRLAAECALLLNNTRRYPEGSEEKAKLESLANAAIVSIEGAADSDQVALETTRGKQQMTLYNQYLAATELIEGYGLSDPSELLSEAESTYSVAKSSLSAAATQTSMTVTMNDAAEAFSQTVARAEADAYRQTYGALLDKIDAGSITAEDLPALEAAIDAATPERMSALANGALSSELSKLAKAYRSAVAEKIEEILTNHALPNPTDPLTKLNQSARVELKDRANNTSFSTDDLAAFRDTLTALLMDAEAVDSLISHVTDHIRTDPLYPTYDTESVAAIEEVCQTAVGDILNPENTKDAGEIAKAAMLDADRHEALAKLRLSAQSYMELATVKALMDELTDQILNQPQTPESLDALVEDATFRISVLVAKHEIDQAAKAAKETLNGLGFLTDEERAAALAEIDRLSTLGKEQADLATTPEALAEARTRITQAIAQALEDAKTANQTRESAEKKAQTEQITKQYNDLKQAIEAMPHLSDEERSTLLEQLDNLLEEALSTIEGAKTHTDLTETVMPGLETKIKELTEDAQRTEELAEYRSLIEDRLNGLDTARGDYSEENQAALDAILQEAQDKLAKAETQEDYAAIEQELEERIAALPNRLDDAKTQAEQALTDSYNQIMANRPSYSEQDLAEIEALYRQALADLKTFTELSQIQDVEALAAAGVAKLKTYSLQTVFTGDQILASDRFTDQDYDPWSGGYYGSVLGTQGFSSESTLFIYDGYRDGVAEKIMKAAKNKQIVTADGTLLAKDINRLLKHCSVTAAFDIVLTPTAEGNTYTVSILLPKGTDLSAAVGIVFLREDGSAEYYEMTADHSLITFTVGHFSEFYLVSADTVQLWWVIVLLSLVLFAEIAVLALLYMRKSKGYTALLPVLFNPYRPTGAPMIITLLSIAILILAGWIAVLLIMEYIAKHPREKKVKEPMAEPHTEELPAPPAEPEPLSEPEPIPVLPPDPRPETIPLPPDPRPEAIPLPPDPKPEPIPLPAPEQTAQVILLPEPEPVDERDGEHYTGNRRGEINLDTLSAHFEAEERVTLNSLKEKKLVSGQTGYVKILARGRLDKPMTIVAQGFSRNAWQSILDAEGTPIITKQAPDREHKK